MYQLITQRKKHFPHSHPVHDCCRPAVNDYPPNFANIRCSRCRDSSLQQRNGRCRQQCTLQPQSQHVHGLLGLENGFAFGFPGGRPLCLSFANFVLSNGLPKSLGLLSELSSIGSERFLSKSDWLLSRSGWESGGSRCLSPLDESLSTWLKSLSLAGPLFPLFRSRGSSQTDLSVSLGPFACPRSSSRLLGPQCHVPGHWSQKLFILKVRLVSE